MREKIARVADMVSFVQLDIMDGFFVPAKTWPYVPGGPEEFHTFRAEEDGLPSWEKINFEMDLMVRNPEETIDDWVGVGASRVIVHIESTENFAAIVEQFRKRFAKTEQFEVGAVELGVAINIDTPNEALEPFVDSLDFVQFMGIAKIGYQGQPFDARVLPKIIAWRHAHPEATISVDGGVSPDSADLLVEAGANRLVSGSHIFESNDIEGAIRELEETGS